jgi:leader peptidase (prepilin peptidase)/N-methyltransferase
LAQALFRMCIYGIIISFSVLFQFILHYFLIHIGYSITRVKSIIFALTTGLVIAYVTYKYGISYRLLIYAVLIELLMCISLVDIEHKIIPDRLNLAVALTGTVHLTLVDNIYSHILAFFAAGLLFLLMSLISKGGIGGGDVKLIASLGLVYGLLPITYIICYSLIIAAIAGALMIVIGNKNLRSEIALAPYICITAIVYIAQFSKIN